MTFTLTEVQVDSLVGLSHHFGGHAHGNLASQQHRDSESSPKQAALQSLGKMIWVMERGGIQLVLPPLRRPHLATLSALGYFGEPHDICSQVWQENPTALKQVSSSSFIWTANLGYVCPSTDASDGQLHLGLANLNSHFHRQLEAECRRKHLNVIFSKTGAQIHPPIPFQGHEDEGAANHTRLVGKTSGPLHIFVHGGAIGRQRLEAQCTWVRQAGIKSDQVLFLTQHPKAIEAGVFHNDVIATGWNDHYLCHELAYDAPSMDTLKRCFSERGDLNLHVVKNDDFSLSESVECYLFNSQFFTAKNGDRFGLAPMECHQERPKKVIEKINSWLGLTTETINLKESMMNGGGPACLRWRCPMTTEEIHHLHQGVILTPHLAQSLKAWIERYHDESFTWESLWTKKWWDKEKECFEELTRILNWPEAL